ncbi:efflux transporter periplasmic adaptor subunit, partial [Paucibacter sp. XJ19-41]|nr:efflux transporter periplasmic adaptor subunit [Paucibacter sp. XJ19-41]
MNKTFNTGLLAAALLIAAGPATSQTAAKAKPALSVNLVSASAQQWEQAVQAGGTVAAWQEAVVSAELSGLRLAEVRAQVGDRVRRG